MSRRSRGHRTYRWPNQHFRLRFAGFGEHEFYPAFVDKAAVLLERLAQPSLTRREQARRRVTLRVFVEINVWMWQSYPTVDEADRAILSVAGRVGAREDQHVAEHPPDAHHARAVTLATRRSSRARNSF